MKTNRRWASSLLLVAVVSSIPLLGCRRIATDALDRGVELAFSEAGDGGGDVRIGHLPDDFPKNAPIDPKATILTAASIPDQNGGKGWMAAFQTDETPEQVLAFYDARLHRVQSDASELSAMSFQESGLSRQFSGAQMSQSFDGQNGVGQKQVLTMYELGKGMLVVRTFATSESGVKTSAKTTFTLIVTDSNRPTH
jgi:hypothetical protein